MGCADRVLDVGNKTRTLQDARATHRGRFRVGKCSLVVAIGRPLPDIAQHVMDTPGIRLHRAHRRRGRWRQIWIARCADRSRIPGFRHHRWRACESRPRIAVPARPPGMRTPIGIRSGAGKLSFVRQRSEPERVIYLRAQLGRDRAEGVVLVEVFEVPVQHEEQLAARLRNPDEPTMNAEDLRNIVVLEQADPIDAARKTRPPRWCALRA